MSSKLCGIGRRSTRKKKRPLQGVSRIPQCLESEEDVENMKSVVKQVTQSCRSMKKELSKVLYRENQDVSRQKIEEDVRTIRRSVDDLHRLMELGEYESEKEIALKSENRKLKRDYETLQRQTQENTDAHSRTLKEEGSVKEENKALMEENQELRVELANKKKKLLELEQIQKSIEQVDSIEKNLKTKENENEKLNHEIQKLKKDNNSLEDELKSSRTEFDNLQQTLSLKHIQQQENEDQLNELQADINRLQYKLQKEVDAKDHALNRLSALAAVRLKDNNPNITDLSDPNRPLKVGEKLTRLYDDEWTDAIEALEDEKVTELDGIKILLELLTETFTVCKSWSTSQLTTIRALLACPQLEKVKGEIRMTNELNDEMVEIPDPPQEIMKMIKDHRKEVAKIILPKILKALSPHLKHELNLNDAKMKACDAYIEKCVELCWYMLVQDPPMDLCWQYKHGDPFPSNSFRSYTASGDKVDYVVWPSLYLYENGSIISKGVCQGLK
ncbi:hypothetical protein ScPMuIL_010671 [Solemya velum]